MSEPVRRWDESGRLLGSLDTVEDAVALLRESGFNWVLLVGTHQNASTIHSDLDKASAFMLDDWNERGVLQEDFRRHLEPLLHAD